MILNGLNKGKTIIVENPKCYFAGVFVNNNFIQLTNKTAAVRKRNRPRPLKVCQATSSGANVRRSVSHEHQKGLHILNSLLNRSLFIFLH